LNLSKEQIRQAGQLILVEGYTDYAALYQAGYKNVAASLGTSLTADQISLGMRFAPAVIINYDGDAAGLNAALRAVSVCFEKGIQASVLVLPEQLDPDGFIKKYGQDRYRQLIAKSIPAIKFLIEAFARGKRLEVPEEKARVAREIAGEIEKIPDTVVRSEYIKQVSEYLRVDEALLRDFLRQKPAGERGPVKEFFLPAEKRLLQIMMDKRILWTYIFAEMRDGDLRDLKSEPIFRLLKESFSRDKSITFSEIKQGIAPDLANHLARVLLEQGEEPTVDEALDCLSALRKISLEKRLREVQAEIVQLERKGEKDKIGPLLHQRQDLTRQILAL
jgi:DNA primase